MAEWIVADWHLGEDRLEIMGRPFRSAEEMIDELVRLHNSVVTADDTVYVLGDLCYQKKPEYLEHVERFNGRKMLIRGNHDRVFSDEQLKKYFWDVVVDGGGMELACEGIPCYITHYPTRGKKDRFNLVGHIHAAWKYQLNMMNVGVDVHHFLPVNLSTIPFHLKAISEYYDEDVWVAYNKLNLRFLGDRGKKGSYFVEST